MSAPFTERRALARLTGAKAAAAMALHRLDRPAPEYVERDDLPCKKKLVDPADLP